MGDPAPGLGANAGCADDAGRSGRKTTGESGPAMQEARRLGS